MFNETKNKEEDRAGLLIGGSIVLGVGVLFLLVNLGVIPGLYKVWPIFIIIVGLALIIGGVARGKKTKDTKEI